MIAHSLLVGGAVITVAAPAFAFAVHWWVERDMRKHAHYQPKAK